MRIDSPGFRWDDLRVFLALYRSGSTARAAQLLALNQSTVSRRLSALESDLGARLFDRTPDGVAPTEAAERLLGAAELAERAAHEAGRAVAGHDAEVAGTVRLAMPEGVATDLVAPGLPALFERHPAVRVEIVTGNAVVDLTRREADVALRMIRPERGDLVFKRLASSGYGVFVARDAAASAPRSEAPRLDALDALEWIAWDDTLAHLPDARWLSKHVTAAPRLRTASMPAMIAAARAGVGAVILPRLTAAYFGDLVEVATPEPIPFEVHMYLVTHRALRQVPRIAAVWEFLEDAVATAMAALAPPAPAPPAPGDALGGRGGDARGAQLYEGRTAPAPAVQAPRASDQH